MIYNGNVFVKSLNLISNPNTGHYNIAHLYPLRERALKLFGGKGSGRKLYVSRRNARARKVANENVIQGPLEKAGFEFVELDGIPFAEQVKMFSECSELISIHGAAFTNMLFMPAGGKIVELYPRGFTARDFFNPCYKRLSTVLSHEHTYVLSERSDATPFDLHNDDIVVDLSRIMNVIG
jgi:capsular polysaccharide biosynthesis protein